MHKTAQGRMVWQWHACVACARVTGKLANHPRFAVEGESRQCPIAEHANDRLYEVLPCETVRSVHSNEFPGFKHQVHSTSSRLKSQELRIKSYEQQRGELMSALGAALCHLNNMGETYPHWWWAMYEKSRVSGMSTSPKKTKSREKTIDVPRYWDNFETNLNLM